MYRMRVFAALVRDIDRNLSNILHTPDWRVLMIDFTRAFRLNKEILNQKDLLIVDPALFRKMESMTRGRGAQLPHEERTRGGNGAPRCPGRALPQGDRERGEASVLY